MRKMLFAFFAGLLCISTGCKDSAKVSAASSTDNAATQKNLDANKLISNAFENGDASAVDSVVAEDFVDHTEHGPVKGRDSLKAMIKMVHDYNKDMKMETIHEMGDNDYVFSWVRLTGTSDGRMMPAGPYDWHAIEVSKFKDGKIVEHWEFDDPAEMMKMMSQMSENKMAPPKMDDKKDKK